jgi:multiple sugar transport system permease protein
MGRYGNKQGGVTHMASTKTGTSRGGGSHAPGELAPDESPSVAVMMKSKPRRRRGNLVPYFFIGPSVLFLGATMLYPLFRGVQLSTTDTSLLAPNGGTYIGLNNYAAVLQSPAVGGAVGLTVLYAALSVAGALSFGLVVALLLNHQVRGRSLLRSIIILPWAAPPIAVALIFSWMLNNQYGVWNYLLKQFGFIQESLNWLDSPDRALPAVLLVTIWMTFPIVALILLAALQSVPSDLYEAAKIDGADGLNIYKNVTWPGIRPTVYVVTLLLTIWALRRFDILWVLTRGGPGSTTTTLVVRLYREAFESTNLGLAAAIGVVGVVLSLGVTAVYYIVTRRSERVAEGSN